MKLRRLIVGILTAAIAVNTAPCGTAAASTAKAAGTDNEKVSAARIWDGSADTKWYTGKKDSYDIYTAEQLAGFAQLVDKAAHDDRFRGITINLMNDIVLNDTSNWQEWSRTNPPKNEWNPIGKEGGPISGYRPFAGTFNGNGHTVSGMFYSAKEKNPDPAGLFSYTSGAVISGLRVEKSVIDVGEKKAGQEFNSPSGILVGECENTVFESCMSKDCIIRVSACATFTSHHVGGLVGCDVKVNATAAVAIPLLMMTNLTLIWELIPAVAESSKVKVSGTYLTGCAAENVTIDVCGLSFINTTEVGGLIGCGDDGIFLYNCYTKDISVSKREGFKTTSKPRQAGAVVGRGKGEIKKCYTCNFKRTDGYTEDRYDKNTAPNVKLDKLTSKDFVKKLGKGFEYKSGSAPKIKAINEPEVKIVLSGKKAEFTWNKAGGAKKYEICLKSGGKYSVLASTEKTSVKLSEIKKGKTYDMMIRAVMSDGTYKDIGGKFTLRA